MIQGWAAVLLSSTVIQCNDNLYSQKYKEVRCPVIKGGMGMEHTRKIPGPINADSNLEGQLYCINCSQRCVMCSYI